MARVYGRVEILLWGLKRIRHCPLYAGNLIDFVVNCPGKPGNDDLARNTLQAGKSPARLLVALP